MNFESLDYQAACALMSDFLYCHYEYNVIMGTIKDADWLEQTAELNIPHDMDVDAFARALDAHIESVQTEA